MNLIYLTDTAKRIQDQTMDLANQTLNEALVNVDPAEIELCKSVLQQVYDNLK
jgi:hypothetical protein